MKINIYNTEILSHLTNATYFQQINLDHDFITTYSETSDNRPYITPNISSETTPEEQTSNVASIH